MKQQLVSRDSKRDIRGSCSEVCAPDKIRCEIIPFTVLVSIFGGQLYKTHRDKIIYFELGMDGCLLISEIVSFRSCIR